MAAAFRLSLSSFWIDRWRIMYLLVLSLASLHRPEGAYVKDGRMSLVASQIMVESADC
jgi:hypothetical protein